MEWLRDLVVENKIEVTGKSLLICLKGVVKMENKIDPLHNQNHVIRMIRDALLLVKVEKLTVDWPILLMAICWHDVWTAKNVPRNIFDFGWEYVWDGMGSARMFDKEAKENNLDREPQQAELIVESNILRARFNDTTFNTLLDRTAGKVKDEISVSTGQFEDMSDEELAVLAEYREKQRAINSQAQGGTDDTSID